MRVVLLCMVCTQEGAVSRDKRPACLFWPFAVPGRKFLPRGPALSPSGVLYRFTLSETDIICGSYCSDASESASGGALFRGGAAFQPAPAPAGSHRSRAFRW